MGLLMQLQARFSVRSKVTFDERKASWSALSCQTWGRETWETGASAFPGTAAHLPHPPQVGRVAGTSAASN